MRCLMFLFLLYLNGYQDSAVNGMILAYFPKMKVSLSNHQSVFVCVCPTNNFWTAW
jgi:hypothetical protein